MDLTAAAQFLNTAFSGFDRAFLGLQHAISVPLGGILTPLMRIITLLGEKGIIFFLLALGMMCFPKTRRLGVCIFGAVCCGALITNLILKDFVARPRPFETLDIYRRWWEAIGAPAEDGFSFPSGHVTAAAAGMTALWIRNGKKWMFPAILWVFIMCFIRNYLMAHYPSDCLFAAGIGALSGVIAHLITELIFYITERNSGTVWADFILDWSLPDFAGIPSKLGLLEKQNRRTENNRPVQHESGKGSASGYVGKHLK